MLPLRPGEASVRTAGSRRVGLVRSESPTPRRFAAALPWTPRCAAGNGCAPAAYARRAAGQPSPQLRSSRASTRPPPLGNRARRTARAPPGVAAAAAGGGHKRQRDPLLELVAALRPGRGIGGRAEEGIGDMASAKSARRGAWARAARRAAPPCAGDATCPAARSGSDLSRCGKARPAARTARRSAPARARRPTASPGEDPRHPEPSRACDSNAAGASPGSGR